MLINPDSGVLKPSSIASNETFGEGCHFGLRILFAIEKSPRNFYYDVAKISNFVTYDYVYRLLLLRSNHSLLFD